MEEATFKTMYALLSDEQYESLNNIISELKGYPDKTDTVRYAPEAPQRDALVSYLII